MHACTVQSIASALYLMPGEKAVSLFAVVHLLCVTADKTFADSGGSNCPAPNATVPKYQPGGFCPILPYNGNFCASSQPAWSAFREPTYGHGVLTFMNSTTALWQWNRNIDSEAVIGDSVYIIRQMTCQNKMSYTASAPPTAGALTATSG